MPNTNDPDQPTTAAFNFVLTRRCHCPTCGRELTPARAWFTLGVAMCEPCHHAINSDVHAMHARIWLATHKRDVATFVGLLFYTPRQTPAPCVLDGTLTMNGQSNRRHQ